MSSFADRLGSAQNANIPRTDLESNLEVRIPESLKIADDGMVYVRKPYPVNCDL